MILDKFENNYLSKTSIEYRKKYAQFFTPLPIAEIMAQWLLGNGNLKTVLEPAFGLGIFSRILLNYKPNLIIKGFEIDLNIFEQAQEIFLPFQNVNLLLKDYIYYDWENKYDGIICNPPYFKFHDYDNKKIIAAIEEKLAYQFSGFTNLYSLFIVKSLWQLNLNGRAAYLVPSEFMNSDYGKQIKSYLIKDKSLRYVIVIDFQENIFNDALTTASLLLFAKDNQSHTVQFININKNQDLVTVEELLKAYPHYDNNNIITFKQIKSEIKWRYYYQQQNSQKYKNLIPFSLYGKVVRGIATGANNYFCFNQSQAEKHQISSQYLLPCICKSRDVKTLFFRESNFQQLKQEDKQIFLFNAISPEDEAVKLYIEKGIREKINQKYLTSTRNPWYRLENREVAPIWVSVFHRKGLRFIRNEANISNLTTFHGVYVNPIYSHKLDLLFAYLLTDIAQEIFNDYRREYGNGLKKFEPNDLNKAQILNLDLLDNKQENEIINLLNLYRKSEIEQQPTDYFLQEINNIFLEFAL